MDKNAYLTRREQEIFNAIFSADIIQVGEIQNLFPQLNSKEINKICSSLSSKGYLYRLKRGTYLVQQRPSTTPVIKNPYRVATAIFKGYIGFSSALRVYDLLEYEPFTIFVVTDKKSAERKIGEYTLKWVAMGDKAEGATYYQGLYISTLAKTFFDCFYRPQYGGGYSTITKALYEAELDWEEFLSYFKEASSSLCQRTGYVLELLNKNTRKVPQNVIDYFSKRTKNNTKLVPSGRAKGEYIKKWMLVDNLGKENILSWWYHG